MVRRHRVDDSIARALAEIVRSDLIIVDDIGVLPVSEDAAEGFYRLVDAAYERRSIAVSPVTAAVAPITEVPRQCGQARCQASWARQGPKETA